MSHRWTDTPSHNKHGVYGASLPVEKQDFFAYIQVRITKSSYSSTSALSRFGFCLQCISTYEMHSEANTELKLSQCFQQSGSDYVVLQQQAAHTIEDF